jgi:GDP-L-fucose synthase
VDDLADAVVYLLENYNDEPIVNIGWGEDVTIRQLAELVTAAAGYEGRMEFDASKPDGTPCKLLDPTRLCSLGWRPKFPLRVGKESAYSWFRAHAAEARL